jgi:hypothetical protein
MCNTQTPTAKLKVTLGGENLKLKSHLLSAKPRTTPVSYWDDPGRSGVKLLLRSHLPRQHYGNCQITTKDAPGPSRQSPSEDTVHVGASSVDPG